MTRKDYQLLAETIATAWWHNSDYKSHFASTLADKLENENPRFDRLRFLVACGVVEAPMKTVSKLLKGEGK